MLQWGLYIYQRCIRSAPGDFAWRRRYWWLQVGYTVLVCIADFVEDHLYPLGERIELPTSDAESWTEDETLRRLRGADVLPDTFEKICRLDDRTVSKTLRQIDEDIPAAQNHEALAIQLVRQHTHIPVPRLYQTYSHPLDEETTYLIMDFVKGERLDHAWPKLSWLARARVAWTLRSYVRQLRKIKTERSLIPGPLGPRPLFCLGYNWTSTDEALPFVDAPALFARLEARHEGPGRRPKPSVFEGFDKPQPLVFVHNDLCMRNIILGDDGQVWLIDWGVSGFYPEFFEFTNMQLAVASDWSSVVPMSWKACIPFIADPYYARKLWVLGLGY